MIYAIKFKSNFNNFEAGDVIKFRRGNLFVAPYGNEKTYFTRMLFDNFTGNTSTLELNSEDLSQKHIFYLSFASGLPELFTHNVSSDGVIECNKLISSFDFHKFYLKFVNGSFRNSILIVDNAFSCLMPSQAQSLWISFVSRFAAYGSPDTNNQYFFADNNGFMHSYYSSQDVYFLPAKTWLTSIFLSRCSTDLSDLYALNTLHRSKGYVVLIEGLSVIQRSYGSHSHPSTYTNIGARFVETSTTLTSSADATKIYVTKASAEKVIEIFKKRTKQFSHISINIRPSLKARYDWCSNLNFTKADYKILTVEEFKDFLFNSKEIS